MAQDFVAEKLQDTASKDKRKETMNKYRFTMDDGREFEIHADSMREANAKLGLVTNGRGTVAEAKEVRHV